MKIPDQFKQGDIVRALVSSDLSEPMAIREGNLYEIATFPRNQNSGVIFIRDKAAGNLLISFAASFFELVHRPEADVDYKSPPAPKR